MKTKYRNKKITVDGETFDSRKEYRRYTELKLMEQAGEVRNIQRQVKYVLIPAQRDPDTIGPRGGVKKGKLIEREVSYIADFVYEIWLPTYVGIDIEGWWRVVEDTKGVRTKDYVIKRKLMLWVHGIRIREI